MVSRSFALRARYRRLPRAMVGGELGDGLATPPADPVRTIDRAQFLINARAGQHLPVADEHRTLESETLADLGLHRQSLHGCPEFSPYSELDACGPKMDPRASDWPNTNGDRR